MKYVRLLPKQIREASTPADYYYFLAAGMIWLGSTLALPLMLVGVVEFSLRITSGLRNLGIKVSSKVMKSQH